MTTVDHIRAGAHTLPEDQRFELLVDLMASLPATLADFDDGSAEAGRRLAEMRRDPSSQRSWAEIKDELGR